MLDERLRIRLGLRLWPLRHRRSFRWAWHAGAVLTVALPLLLLAPQGLARLASPRHTLSVPATSSLVGLAVDPILDRVFVVGADGSVWTLDGTGRRLLAAGAGGGPADLMGTLAVDAVRHRVYLATMAEGVVVLNGTTAEPAVPIPFTAVAGLAVDTAAGRLLMSRPAGRAVTVLDAGTDRVLATTHLGSPPAAIAVDPGTHRVYVAEPVGSRIVVLDGTTGAVLTTIPLGHAPGALALNPATGHIFVTNAADASVSVVDTRRNVVVATVPVGQLPVAIAANTRTGRVYVANSNSRTISVVEHDGWGLLPLLAMGSWRR